MEKTFDVKGMHCKSCNILITDVVSEISGVTSVAVDFKSGKVSISYSDESVISAVKAAIEKEGYTVV